MSKVELHLGDCLEVMRGFLNNSIDTVITDPPYGSTACKWDSIIPLIPMWNQVRRIIKSCGVIVMTASQPFTSSLIASNLAWFRYALVWDKALPSGHLNAKKRPLNRHDDLVVFSSQKLGRFTYNPQMEIRGKPRNKGCNIGGGSNEGAKVYGKYAPINAFNNTYYPTSIIRISNAKRKGKLHATQKPVALMEYLIRTYTKEGETILDFAMGSGTTGVACVNTERNFIGIEIEEPTFDSAKARIEHAQRSSDDERVQSKAQQLELIE